jgi:hypothetical protein
MNIIYLTLLFAVAQTTPQNIGECAQGPDTTVDEVIITFTCGDPKRIPDQIPVRWFNRFGTYKAAFEAERGKVKKFPYPISPRAVMLTSEAARGCISGQYVTEDDGRCRAMYQLRCAERQYVLTVASVPPVDYAIVRAIVATGRRAAFCNEEIKRPATGIGKIAAGERVTIDLYGAVDRNLSLLTLPDIDLDSAPAQGRHEVYDSGKLTHLIEQSVRGQGGAAPSANSEALVARRKQNVPQSVTIKVEPR